MPDSTKNLQPLWLATLLSFSCAASAITRDLRAEVVEVSPEKMVFPISSIDFSPDGKQFTIGTTIIRDTETGKTVRTLPVDRRLPDGYGYASFAWSPDGKFYAAGIVTEFGELWGTARVWNRKSGKQVLEYRAIEGTWKQNHGGAVAAVLFSPDGRYLITNGVPGRPADHQIQVRDFPSGKLVHKFRSKSFRAAISPDSNLLSDGWRIWSMKTGRLLHDLRGSGPPAAVRFSPDGKQLLVGRGQSISGLGAGHGAIYDVTTGKQIRRLPRATDPTAFDLRTMRSFPVSGRDFDFSPDGRILALQETPSGKNVLILRDMKSGRLLHRLTGHKRGVHSVAFSPDGKLVLTGDGERTVRFWDLKSGELLRKIVLPVSKPPDFIDRSDLYEDKDGRLRRRKR